MLGLLDEPVAVGRAGHHRLVAGAGAVQLAAPGTLADLRALVLGDHSLELSQLVLRRAGVLAAAGEDDLHAGPGELLEHQHLVGVAAREPIRGVAQQHLARPFGGAVAQPLQRRPGEPRAREPLVLEHEIVEEQQPALGGELTQPDGLALDRLVLALAF